MADSDNKLPFWIHQAVEYLVGLIVLFEAARVRGGAAIGLGVGLLMLLLASTGEGPLSAFRKVPRHVHRIGDIVLMVVAAAAAVVFRSRLGAAGTGLLSVVVVVLGALTWRTDYRPKQVRPPLRERLPKVDAERVGRGAGKVVGSAAVAGRSWWRSRKP